MTPSQSGHATLVVWPPVTERALDAGPRRDHPFTGQKHITSGAWLQRMSLDIRVPPSGMQIKRHRRTFQLVQILELKGRRFLELEWPFWGAQHTDVRGRGVGAVELCIPAIRLSGWDKLHLKPILPLDFSNSFYYIVWVLV